jgi:GR25 family glycosyltransferase involved in LPS biosynthesis
MDYAGTYINLDRSPERRAQIEAELARCNLEHYTRFAAADGNILNLSAPSLAPGVVGCWTSHYLLLKQNIGSEKHLHVMEDDIIFAPSVARVISWAIESGCLDRFDILYTDVSIPLLNDAYKIYKAFYDKTVTRDEEGNVRSVQFEVIDISKILYAGMTSYLVNKNSIAKLHNLYEAETRSGLSLPIDLFIRSKSHAGALKVGCIFPFVTTFRLESGLNSDINPDEDRRGIVAGGIGRYAFFIGCDWDLCRAYADKYAPPPKDRLTALLGQLLTYSLTDKYRLY